MAKNTGKVREKSGNFVRPQKWKPCSSFVYIFSRKLHKTRKKHWTKKEGERASLLPPRPPDPTMTNVIFPVEINLWQVNGSREVSDFIGIKSRLQQLRFLDD